VQGANSGARAAALLSFLAHWAMTSVATLLWFLLGMSTS